MKKIVLVSILFAASVCSAQETARVISATPMMQQFNVPRQVCVTEQVAVQKQSNSGSGLGTFLGGLAGAALGNQVGGGNGKTIATVVGGLGGALVGSSLGEAGSGDQQQFENVRRCTTENNYENRMVGYNVTYEFGGKQYATQLPGNPGGYVDIKIVPSMPSNIR